MPMKFIPFESPGPSGDFYVGFSLLFFARVKIGKIHTFILTYLWPQGMQLSHHTGKRQSGRVSCVHAVFTI